jgi:hypothetical protein
VNLAGTGSMPANQRRFFNVSDAFVATTGERVNQMFPNHELHLRTQYETRYRLRSEDARTSLSSGCGALRMPPGGQNSI